jgi:uncharacterized OB-fold protein
MLIACKHCGNAVASEAKRCPRCGGEPYLRFKPIRAILAAFVLACVATINLPEKLSHIVVAACVFLPVVHYYFSDKDLRKRRIPQPTNRA